MSVSEVARLLEQISLEHETAQNALTGLTSGIARHDFINAKEERIAVLHGELSSIIGQNEATRLVIDVYDKE